MAPPIEIGSRLVFRWVHCPEVFRSFFKTVSPKAEYTDTALLNSRVGQCDEMLYAARLAARYNLPLLELWSSNGWRINRRLVGPTSLT